MKGSVQMKCRLRLQRISPPVGLNPGPLIESRERLPLDRMVGSTTNGPATLNVILWRGVWLSFRRPSC